MLTKTIATVAATVSLCGLVSLGAIAQTTGAQPPAATNAPTSPSGTTSGPASGSPTTMGTTGTTTGTPHQLDSVRDQSSSVKRQTEQSGASQAPASAGTGQPGSAGTESGAAPKK
jgi:hypothetical protein